MPNVQLTAGAGTYVATNQVSRDGQSENMEIVNFGDPSTATCVSVTPAGAGGTNAAAVQGVAGGVPIPVTTGGNNATITQLAGATATTPQYVKTSAGRCVRLVNTSLTALASTVQIVIIDQSSGAANANNIIYQCTQMGAGQVIDLQIPTLNGLGIYLASGSLSSNIVLTWS